MINLVWYDFLEIGVDSIDEDHKNLLKIMLAIKNAIEINNHSKCIALLNKFIKEVRDHFSREEKILYEAKYPGLEKHKLYHKELLIKADETKVICENFEKEHDLTKCFDSMFQFIVDDIVKGDFVFKSYLEYEGFAKKK